MSSGLFELLRAELILRLGFEYLASVAFRSGLRHPTRRGVFYGRAYKKDVSVKMKLSDVCHEGRNPIGWWTNPPRWRDRGSFVAALDRLIKDNNP